MGGRLNQDTLHTEENQETLDSEENIGTSKKEAEEEEGRNRNRVKIGEGKGLPTRSRYLWPGGGEDSDPRIHEESPA